MIPGRPDQGKRRLIPRRKDGRIDPAWTWLEASTAARAGSDAPVISQLMSKAYVAAPSELSVAVAVDVGALPPWIVVTPLACRCPSIMSPYRSSA
jgi:hypothetical protein